MSEKKQDKALGSLLKAIDALKHKLDAVRPLAGREILQAVDTEYTYDSNRIEGNTLTLRETDIIVNKGLTVGGRSMREHLEATNHHEAVAFIRKLAQEQAPLSERTVKEVHALILRGIDRENAGIYRSVPVAISGSRHVPPQPWQVPKLMEELFLRLQKEAGQFHPIVYAAELHEGIATIHPFIDGNGRTARLLMNLALLQEGYAITNISGVSRNRLAYYDALEKCNLEQDKTAFLLLIARYV
ncbi:MAG: Fic family protein, partial [Candidatus Electrothrix sp.]